MADTTEAVDRFMASLDHPAKTLVESIRRCVLSADPGIAEGIKWNSPSYRTREYFATTNLRERQGVGVILHLGAKVRDLGPDVLAIDDPSRSLKWLGRDRAMIVFADVADLQARRDAFVAIVRSWLPHV